MRTPGLQQPRASRRRRALRQGQSGRVAKVVLWTLAVVLLLGGLLLAGLTWGPNLLREPIARYIGETIGRGVRIGRIDVSPFAGRIVLSEVSVASLDPGKPMLSARTATIDVDPLAYLRGAVVVNGVSLEAPALRVLRTGPARFDFSDVLDRFANRPASQRKVVWHVERIAVADGSVTLDDRVVRKLTTLDAIRLAVVGLTNRDAHVDRPVTLDATFALNGRPVSIDASATPFAQPATAQGRLRLDALPVSDLLPYLPMPADLRPVAGTLDLDLRAAWGSPGKAEGPLKIEGRVALGAPRIEDAAGGERVAARGIVATLAPSFPLGGTVHLTGLAVDAPVLALGRAADGSPEWPASGFAGSRRAVGGDATASPVAPAAPVTASPARRPGGGPRALRIDTITIDGGQVAWRDAALAVPLALRIDPLKVSVAELVIADLSRPEVITGRARVDATLDGHAPLGADLDLQGVSGLATLTAGRLELQRYAPLAGGALKATLEQGLLDARAAVHWNTADASWSIADGGAELSDLRVAHEGRKPASMQKLAVAGVVVDGVARSVEVGSVKLDGVVLAVRRGADGRVDLQDWYVPQPVVAGDAGAGRSDARGAASAAPWTMLLRQVELSRLDLDYTDVLIAKDRRLPPLTLSAKASDVTLDPRRPLPFEAVATLPDGSRLASSGTVRPVPFDLDARLRLQRFTLTHFDPYVAPFVNLTLASGQLWSNGRLRLASGEDGALARIGFDGEVSANEFRATDKLTSEDFVRWTALALPSVKVDWDTKRPGASLVEIGAVAFVDFYARIILSPEGRLNLSDVFVDPDRPIGARSLTTAPDAATRRATAATAAAAAPAYTGEGEATAAGTAQAAPARGAPVARREAIVAKPAREPGSQPTIRVGTVRIASGNVNFTDLFIRPNYTANLTQLSGSIDAIASDREAPSDVLVTGRVDDDTPLEITGKVNPLSPRTFIDLRAIARGFDLPKLSAYSGRWAGYTIEKGKMTADVRYRIEGERLQAENKITINQLTFGDKVESADALNLPVRLAVSLLKDRNGNIDLDLPISGTLSDPQFSVGGLILRALGNLIVKVVTSPFTALASLAGGGTAAELSHIDFAAGSAALDDDDRKRLDALGRALTERPALSLDIAGYADPQADRDAMQRERLDTALRSAKLAQMKRASPGAELPALRDVALEAGERPALLEQLWRDAKLDAGGAKTPAPEDIERLLAEHAPVATEEVKQIAQQRAQAARDFLRDHNGISNERLYLLAPRIAETAGTLPPRRADFAIK